MTQAASAHSAPIPAGAAVRSLPSVATARPAFGPPAVPRPSAGWVLAAALAAALAAGCSTGGARPAPPAEPMVIVNARLFTGDPADGVREGAGVLIVDGRVARVFDSADPEAAAGARRGDAVVVDAGGRTLIPGLVDLHAHPFLGGNPPWELIPPDPEWNFRAFLRSGVTTILDLGGPSHDMPGMAADLESGEAEGPRYFYAGKWFAQRGGHPRPYIDATVPWPLSRLAAGLTIHEQEDGAEDVAAEVRENKDRGALVTKAMVDQIPARSPSLGAERLRRIAAESERLGLPLLAHVGSQEDLLLALDAGVRTFAHGPYRSVLDDAAVARLRDARAAVMPTLAVFERAAQLHSGTLEFNALEESAMPPKALAAHRDRPAEYSLGPDLDLFGRVLARDRGLKYENARRLRAAGVTLVAASDSPNVASAPGASLHREVGLFVTELGMTPLEALAAATSVPGGIVGAWSGVAGLGLIREGSPADLVLLDGPVDQDIRHLLDVALVVQAGRVVDRRPDRD